MPLTTIRNAGLATGVGVKVLQIIQTVKTDTYSASVAQGAISGDVTGFTATITPSSSSNKVLVVISACIRAGELYEGPCLTLYEAGSISGFIGDASGSKKRVTATTTAGRNGRDQNSVNVTFLASPNTTNAVTYSVRLSHNDSNTSTVLMNISSSNNNANYDSVGASSMTLMEIAG